MKKIYYLGPEGSYSYIVTKKSFPKGNLIAGDSFSEIVNKVKEKAKAIGVLPIENSITSSVHENIDHIFVTKIKIIGEAYLRINLHLVGLKDTGLKKIRKVFSHPKALRQCSLFIKRNQLQPLEIKSTAKGKEIVLEKSDESLACIGSKELTKDEKLAVIKENIGNLKHNITRFVFVSQKSSKRLSNVNKKGTFIFKIRHQPGSLAQILNALAKVGINLMKIESRPIPGTNWEYYFWVDLEVPSPEIKIEKIFKENTLEYRVVGIYEKGGVFES